MSLNIITVTLNMGKLRFVWEHTAVEVHKINLKSSSRVLFPDTVNFLGISIVGQSNKGGDGGIYVGSIMKG